MNLDYLGKYYSNDEVNSMVDHHAEELKNEKEKTQRAYEIVNNLTLQLCNKNREIQKLEFYLEAMVKGLNVAGEAIREMRNSTSAERNG